MEYFRPDFKVQTLKVVQLRNLLVQYGIKYHSNDKKPDLIRIFTEEILPHSQGLLAARSQVKRSAQGITDADVLQPHRPQETMDVPLSGAPNKHVSSLEERASGNMASTLLKRAKTRRKRSATSDKRLSEQGNKNLIGPNPIRQSGAREAYKGSLAPATS